MAIKGNQEFLEKKKTQIEKLSSDPAYGFKQKKLTAIKEINEISKNLVKMEKDLIGFNIEKKVVDDEETIGETTMNENNINFDNEEG